MKIQDCSFSIRLNFQSPSALDLSIKLSMAGTNKRYAVVTGSNKGIGLGVVKQLASNGFLVVLTARDADKGIGALQSLKESGFPDYHNVVFHQLDVLDPATLASLAHFIKTQFGKLDVLVNNAGIGGTAIDEDALKASAAKGEQPNWNKITHQSYDLAVECLQTNYYGAKRTSEALLPLLKLSDSPRIVNVSSDMGMLKNIRNEWAKGVLGDADKLTEEGVDQVLSEFLRDFKEGNIESKGWPTFLSAYTVSKAALNAYTRIVAKKWCPSTSNFCINSVCPGFVKTDMNGNAGILSVEEGASSPLNLALLPKANASPTGLFFVRKEVSPF